MATLPEPARARQRLATALTGLLSSHPMYAYVNYRLQRVEDPTCDTAWTDGRRLGYNPTYINSITMDEVKGLLAHEAHHVLGLHPLRRGARDPEGWNVACDHVVNWHVVDMARLRLPAGVLKGVPNTTPEYLYRHPIAPTAPQPNPQDSDEGEGEEEGQQGAGGSGGDEQDEGESEGEGQEQGQGGGGSGAGNQPGKAPGPPSFGEVRDMRNEDGTPMSDGDRDIAEAEAKVMVAQAVRFATKAGSLPGNLADFAQRITASVMPWQEIMARFVDSRCFSNWTWERQNLRYVGAGIIMPTLSTPAYGEMVLAADTSQSVSDAELNQVCTELTSCLSQYADRGQAPRVTMLWCDVAVTAQEIDDETVPLRPVGRGGTRFSPVFEYVEREQLSPRGIIYTTDGECSDFGTEPACPVLWILTRPNPSFNPPFGEVANMADRLA